MTIPKLHLDTCILEETTTKSLKASVTKLYGPSINQVGNFCIAGHNYRNNKMFGGIKKLEKGDTIILTDTYGDSLTYEVYENYQTDPKDVSSLTQETMSEREVTLITCTTGAIKRVIVKAVEVYD
ncbi:MAG: sortase [Clostridia bacterium]|nr:sortase [Clostridia bacterium]